MSSNNANLNSKLLQLEKDRQQSKVDYSTQKEFVFLNLYSQQLKKIKKKKKNSIENNDNGI